MQFENHWYTFHYSKEKHLLHSFSFYSNKQYQGHEPIPFDNFQWRMWMDTKNDENVLKEKEKRENNVWIFILSLFHYLNVTVCMARYCSTSCCQAVYKPLQTLVRASACILWKKNICYKVQNENLKQLPNILLNFCF